MPASTIIAFIPVLHKGYIDFIKKHPGKVYVLGKDIIDSYTSLTRDLRVMEPKDIMLAIGALGIASEVDIVTDVMLQKLGEKGTYIMPDEEVSRDIAEKYFSNSTVKFDSVFLRWNKTITLSEHVVPPHRVITKEKFHSEMIKKAVHEAGKSADWWRQIGSVVVQDGKIIFSEHNKHVPSDFSLATYGDPRSNFDAGQHQEIFTSIHSEALAVAKAAHDGVSLSGATFYVTTFPCPNCARLLSFAGVKKVYYSKGYSLLDAEKILNHFGVEIVLVQE